MLLPQAWRISGILQSKQHGGSNSKAFDKYIDWLHLPQSHPNYKVCARGNRGLVPHRDGRVHNNGCTHKDLVLYA